MAHDRRVTGTMRAWSPTPRETGSSSLHEAAAGHVIRIALCFTQSLAARDYPKAYAMTSEDYRRSHPVEQLRGAFEAIGPIDWGPIGPIQVGHTMTSWPTKQPGDIGRAYVSFGGNTYSEASSAGRDRRRATMGLFGGDAKD